MIRRLDDISSTIDYGVTASAVGSPVGPKFLRITDIQDGFVDWDAVPWCSCTEKEALSCQLQDGDIVFARTGATTGKSFLIRKAPQKSVFASYLIRVRLGDEANPVYVSHFFNSPSYWRQITGRARGVAQPGVNSTSLKTLEIPLPPLAEQKRIAGILDAADALRAKRREALAQLDTLLQATFLDLFGDPIANPKKWSMKTLPELILPGKNALKRGPFGGALKKEIFVESGYLVYEQNHALNNDYSFGRYFITEAKFKELIGFSVKPSDILISCSGVYLGKLSIVPEGAKPGIINQALLKVSLDQQKMKAVVFTYIFGSAQFKQKHFPSDRGMAIPNLPPMDVMKKIGFITPPIEVQQQFAATIESVESQKARTRAHLAELDTLFTSLQSRAFRGEL